MSEIIVYNKPGELKGYLEKNGRAALDMALPKHLSADRFIRICVTEFSKNPKLRECTAQSILSSLIISAQVGLEPGIRGQAYLIPYRDNRSKQSICTFVPGWQGLVQLLNNTERATCWTGAVFEGDYFDYQLGTDPKIVHRPGEFSGVEDKLTHVYAVGRMKDSEIPVMEVWPMRKVLEHRDKYNKVGDRHYSHVYREQYARKVVLLQVLKYMPASSELNNAITAANAVEVGNSVKVVNGDVVEFAPEETPEPPRIGRKEAPTIAPATGEGATYAGTIKAMMKKAGMDEAALEAALLTMGVLADGETLAKLDASALSLVIDSWEGEDGVLDTFAKSKGGAQ